MKKMIKRFASSFLSPTSVTSAFAGISSGNVLAEYLPPYNGTDNLFANGDCNDISSDNGWLYFRSGASNAVYSMQDGAIQCTVNNFSSARGDIVIYQKDVALEANEQYMLSFWMKCSQTVKYGETQTYPSTSQRMLIRVFNNDGTDLKLGTSQYIHYILPPNDGLFEANQWKKVECILSTEGFESVMPEGGKYQIRFHVGAGTIISGDTQTKQAEPPVILLFDNFELKDATPYYGIGNLFANGDCSNSNTGNGWLYYSGGASNAAFSMQDGVIKCTVDSFSSTRGDMVIYQNNIALEANKEYKLSFWMKCSQTVKYGETQTYPSTNQRMLIRVFNNDGSELKLSASQYIHYILPPDGGLFEANQWKKIECILSTEGFESLMPEGGKYRIKFHVGAGTIISGDTQTKQANPSVILLFDNFVLKEKIQSIYVSPSGNDLTGDGSIEKPFKTITKAKEVARAAVNGSDEDITVFLRGGIYRINETITFYSEDSGTDTAKITYKNYGNEIPVISSNVEITGFQEYQNGIYKASIAQNPDGSYPKFRDLYVNGKRATLARTGKKDEYMYFPKTYDNDGMYVNSGILENIPADNLEPIELCLNIEWMNRRFRLASYSALTDGTVKVITKPYEWNVFINSLYQKPLLDNAYWFENHLSLLDEPGEWFYDSGTGTVYYYPLPGENINTAIIEYPSLDVLVKFEGSRRAPLNNISFEGINFTGVTNNYTSNNGYMGMIFNTYSEIDSATNTRVDYLRQPSAFHCNYANNIDIKRCKFYELGTSAISFREGCNNITIEGSTFNNIAMSGIEIGEMVYRAPAYKWCSNISISNNYIENIGTDYLSSVGISVTRVRGLNVVHNYLKHMPWSGMGIGFGWAIGTDFIPMESYNISYNYIEDIMCALNDGGAIYTAGYSPSEFTGQKTIKNNYFKNNGNNSKLCVGIYHDGASNDWLDENNVIDGYYVYPIFCQCTIQTQLVSYIEIKNNFSTVTPIKTNYEISGERQLVFQNNTLCQERSDLPSSAVEIIENTGLLNEYNDIIPVKDTVITINTSSPNLILQSDNTKVVEFTISNNTNSAKTYSVALSYKKKIRGLNGISYYISSSELPSAIEMVPAQPTVTLQPNQQNVKVSAAFGLSNSNNIVPEAYVADFKILSSDGCIYSFPRTVNLMIPYPCEEPAADFNDPGNLLANGNCSIAGVWNTTIYGNANGTAGFEEIDGNKYFKFMINNFPYKRYEMYFSQNNVSLKANKKYKLTFYMKSSERIRYDENKILIRFYTNDGLSDFIQNDSYIDFIPHLKVLEAETWTKITGYMITDGFDIPENSKYSIKFIIGGGVKSTDQVNIYFDNFSFVEVVE